VTSTRTFPCRPDAVVAARRFVREALAEHPLETVEAAELLASELATNCVRHAHTDFVLAVRSAREVRIEVRDSGGGQPRVLSPSPRELTGRGLRIVAAISQAWGVTETDHGKAVWFTLPQDRS
jgi:anti-sigma regulatory factor (Ser/Thr protein kinase)